MFRSDVVYRLTVDKPLLFEKLASPGTYRKVIDSALDKASKQAAGNMKRVLTTRKHNWSGATHRSIRPMRLGWNNYVVKMSRKGVWLDSMKPHFVSFKHRRPWDWFRTKGPGKGKQFTRKPKGMWVKPHPFVDYALRIVNYNKYLEDEISKELKGI